MASRGACWAQCWIKSSLLLLLLWLLTESLVGGGFEGFSRPASSIAVPCHLRPAVQRQPLHFPSFSTTLLSRGRSRPRPWRVCSIQRLILGAQTIINRGAPGRARGQVLCHVFTRQITAEAGTFRENSSSSSRSRRSRHPSPPGKF